MHEDDGIWFLPKIPRRTFLKFCGVLGVMIGVGEMAAPDIAAAIEKLVKRPAVVWSLFQECLG